MKKFFLLQVTDPTILDHQSLNDKIKNFSDVAVAAVDQEMINCSLLSQDAAGNLVFNTSSIELAGSHGYVTISDGSYPIFELEIRPVSVTYNSSNAFGSTSVSTVGGSDVIGWPNPAIGHPAMVIPYLTLHVLVGGTIFLGCDDDDLNSTFAASVSPGLYIILPATQHVKYDNVTVSEVTLSTDYANDLNGGRLSFGLPVSTGGISDPVMLHQPIFVNGETECLDERCAPPTALPYIKTTVDEAIPDYPCCFTCGEIAKYLVFRHDVNAAILPTLDPFNPSSITFQSIIVKNPS